MVGKPGRGGLQPRLDRYGEPPLGVARPASTDEVSRLLALCHAERVAVTPQGGRTGLCGGSVTERSGGVILSLERMRRIEPPGRLGASVIAQAGATLAAVHEAVAGCGWAFPLHLGAEGSAQIGGLIATNAGGSHAFRFGTMQDLVLGLEVVLPNGEIWNGLRRVQKDNAGYQLRRLFCGSEGTLGVVTRAALRLYPAPKTRATALLAAPDAGRLVALGARVMGELAECLTGLEFFSDLGLTLALKNISGLTFPLDGRGGYYLLVEAASASARSQLRERLEVALGDALEAGEALTGAIAESETQRAAFWRLREEMPEGQRLEGPQIKSDLSVPPDEIARFLVEAEQACRKHSPAVRINPFGHLGDGNIHYNLSPPERRRKFDPATDEIAADIARLAEQFRGSFAAEHGLGRSKVALADLCRGTTERTLMRAIKMAFDPSGVMNPGVLLAAP